MFVCEVATFHAAFRAVAEYLLLFTASASATTGGVDRLKLILAVSTQCKSVTHRRTDRQTDAHIVATHTAVAQYNLIDVSATGVSTAIN